MLSKAFIALGLLALPYAAAQTSAPAAVPISAPAASSAPAPSSAPTSSAAAAAVPITTGPPILSLPALGTYQACTTLRLNWQLRNVDANLYTVTFRAHNSGVDQSIPRVSATPASTPTPSSARVSSSTTSFAVITPPAAGAVVPSSAAATSAVATTGRIDILGIDDPVLPSSSASFTLTLPIKRTKLSINQTMGSNNAAVGYSMPINLPEGKYILVASVQQLGVMASVPFTVLEDNDADMSCLAAFAASSAGLSSTGSKSSTATPSGSLAASNGGSAGSNGGISTGAIAGGVVGGLAGLALLGLLAFCLIRRKRRNAAGENGRDMTEKEQAFRHGGAGMKRSTSRPQRLPSESGMSPPASQSSHDHHPTSATAFAAAYQSSLPHSQRASVSSTSSPYGGSPTGTPPRLPESAALGAEGEFEDPFATPGLSSAQQHRLSAPIPAARPESQAQVADRRASSPVALTSPFGPLTPSGTAYPASTAQSVSMSRSTSSSGGKRPSPPGSVGEGMARRGSTKRKAVPSLGPELRKQMERGQGGAQGGGATGMGGRKQFALMPDMPGASGLK